MKRPIWRRNVNIINIIIKTRIRSEIIKKKKKTLVMEIFFNQAKWKNRSYNFHWMRKKFI